jgi:hypothetical protein
VRDHLDAFADLADIAAWMPVASGEARLDLARVEEAGRPAMKLDFDFKGGGGFVVARRTLRRAMPPVYTLSFRVRGRAPENRLELKLADVSGRNVWWHKLESFEPPDEWTTVAIRSRDLEFAWGPQGGGVIGELGAIEIAVVAPPGGRGTIEIADLEIEDRSQPPAPVATASRALPGHEAQGVIAGEARSAWRSGPTQAPEWLELALGASCEHGGFVIEWEPGRAARDFDLSTSLDGKTWTLLRSVRDATATRSYVYASGGGGDIRHVRLDLHRAVGAQGFGIREIEIAPFEFSRSIETFFAGIAAREPRGRYPRWLYREQAYWTPISPVEGGRRALLNEDGLLEVGRRAFSLEPMLAIDGVPASWSEVDAAGGAGLGLADGWLPIPSVVWRIGDAKLTITVCARRDEQFDVLTARYRVANVGRKRLSATLYIAIRPFQVNPPWQSFRGMGGVARVESIALEDGAVWVNGDRAILPSPSPDRFGAAAFDDGSIGGHIAAGSLPTATRVTDAFGYASAALAYDLDLAPDAATDVYVTVPFERLSRPDAVAELERFRPAFAPHGAHDAAVAEWRQRFSIVDLDLGAADPAVAATVKTAASHILTNRYGPALQPGPRRYTRSWIRDGATMAAALLRTGLTDEVRDFVLWYAPFQAADGNVPCCVDEQGADWLVEHDSHGQLIFTIAEYFRFTRDRTLLDATWDAVAKAAGYIETLRASRLTPEYASGEREAYRGLLPESASHEGYLAQPVHSYWDDFWAQRGLGDAAEIARALGKDDEAVRLGKLQADLAASLYASIETVIRKKNLAYVPGSVEWADFDPSATAIALQITDAVERLPKAELGAMFEEYLKGFRGRRDGTVDWSNYTAYEIRIVGALIRLGRRSEANELLEFLLADRRPRAWNQWPEISWRNPRSGGHLGDLPHSWIGAEYVLSMLSMLAYERYADRALVLAAGVPSRWLAKGKTLHVRRLPTYYGSLSYSLVEETESMLRLKIKSSVAPPGGIVVRPPLARALVEATVDGRAARLVDGESVTIPSGPAELVLRF